MNKALFTSTTVALLIRICLGRHWEAKWPHASCACIRIERSRRCSWSGDTLLSQCLSPSRCINGLRHFNAGSNPATEQHPVQVTSRYRHRDKLRLDESLGLYAEFTLPHLTLVGIEALSDRYKNLDRNGVKERKEARLSINFIHLLVYQRLNSLRLH